MGIHAGGGDPASGGKAFIGAAEVGQGCVPAKDPEAKF